LKKLAPGGYHFVWISSHLEEGVVLTADVTPFIITLISVV
jgi:hypothetical protein